MALIHIHAVAPYVSTPLPSIKRSEIETCIVVQRSGHDVGKCKVQWPA